MSAVFSGYEISTLEYNLRQWKDVFQVTIFTGYVWTVGQTGEKNLTDGA